MVIYKNETRREQAMKTNTPLDHFVSMLKANQCLKSARLEHAVYGPGYPIKPRK